VNQEPRFLGPKQGRKRKEKNNGHIDLGWYEWTPRRRRGGGLDWGVGNGV